ncbi:uncharacterized protein LOC117319518 [Pecten maximus]|uniref:uncharacterized protein LOC117319518 n=1 Tax=Pecten maximus TaxID=6579 RepID=UPI00145830A3|nr:uncharacterized protein LOC117319518 [Pecten maximus]
MLNIASDSSESEDTNVSMQPAKKKSKSTNSPVKESLLDKLKKIKSPSLEKAASSSQSKTVISKKRSAEDASIENDSPSKSKKKSKVQTEVGGAPQSPVKSVEERLAHFNERLQEKGLSAASKKRIRRQIKKLKTNRYRTITILLS